MEGAEIRILASLGIPDPYGDDELVADQRINERLPS
jgi:probable rRNA maturation factor